MKFRCFSLAIFTLAATLSFAQSPAPPSYCKPCLFYGGDMDPANPNTGYIENMDTGAVPNEATYVPFRVPKNQQWKVIGLFVNELMTITTMIPAPNFHWSISKGISAGHKGVQIAGGSLTSRTPVATGRSYNGYNEYTVVGYLSPSTTVTLTEGTYWMSAVPVCTQETEHGCEGAYFFLSSVEDVPAPNAVGVEPEDDSFLLWPEGDEFYIPIPGTNSFCGFGDCDRFSAGLLGQATSIESSSSR